MYDAPQMLASGINPLTNGKRVAIHGYYAGTCTMLALVSIAPDTTYFRAATSLHSIPYFDAGVKDPNKFQIHTGPISLVDWG